MLTVKLTTTGDNAEALTEGGALLAAATLCDDASETRYGLARVHRRGVIVLRDDYYDGQLTAAAREGLTR